MIGNVIFKSIIFECHVKYQMKKGQNKKSCDKFCNQLQINIPNLNVKIWALSADHVQKVLRRHLCLFINFYSL